ncbi:MAG TPA: NADH-quinone oxidoreductase subunit L [Solirubrobacterales bacterium]|nr:NADH-quinone oxidoreductase subunit L [Solirubrobacterales bacterium]HMU27286.1 NADH-quinone oxidoreductase subunit L [Solirubrobacterales bacterium]HMX72412.1 NADH-quinone oxidoreductase subunit L [Solirubrobacterales bacterium]HMY25322.1 NADH-quinone oxidoreductase subunit L [Solirubrobacterales bacterium]HNA24930.1 NADH-quinone oxidoreductase subunit L [Solirubrobacterales bacterium]
MTATWAWLVLLLPLLGSMTIGLTFRVLPARTAGLIGVTAIVAAFVCGILALIGLQGEPSESRHVASSLWEYASVGGLSIDLGIYVDPLSIFMVLVVTGVSSLIHIYSYSYMKSDQGYHRFFSYLNFFVFSMLVLVLAGNFIMLIVGWALVGFASYALISYWYRRNTATKAGMKAFVINVIGDIGLYLAAILIFKNIGSVDYGTVFEKAPEVFTTNEWEIVAICLCLLVGAFAKSAQMPFHTWLADAMEGPTPVSSLIHAATMVTAGVYLIARCHSLFELAPTAADVSAWVGLVTLLIAGTIAIAVTDLKRIIAYSTMSQIGYMFVGVSIGAYSAGMFHLMTHAFFKALLFMAAGSFISAMANMQDIDRMKGFRKAMPFTAAMMIIGALALSGFPGTSGWFSKDEIIDFAHFRGGMYDWMWVGMLVGAFMTAVYSFRIIFRILPGPPCEEAEYLEEHGHVIHGEPKNPATGELEDTEVGYPGEEHHIAEQAGGMKFAMAVLGVLALIAGVLQIPGLDDVVTKFLEPTFENSVFSHMHPTTSESWIGLGEGALISLAGIATAWLLYIKRPDLPVRFRERFRWIHTLTVNKWYGDEIIDFLIVNPVKAIGRFCNRAFERFVIDGATTGVAGLTRSAGAAVRDMQSGLLRGYAVLMLFGILAIVIYFLIRSI